MQELELFTNLGLAGAALAIIFFIVRYFVQAMTKKDAYIVEQTKEFTTLTGRFDNTVKNHLSHSTRALTRLSKAVEDLTENNKQQKKK
jgi:hypothetical protein